MGVRANQLATVAVGCMQAVQAATVATADLQAAKVITVVVDAILAAKAAVDRQLDNLVVVVMQHVSVTTVPSPRHQVHSKCMQ